MTESVGSPLQQEQGLVQWCDLRAHCDRQALFLVVAPLTLTIAAAAVAADETSSVGAWLSGGQLRRPTSAEVQSWQSDQEKPFRSVVVQPYVLAVEVVQQA